MLRRRIWSRAGSRERQCPLSRCISRRGRGDFEPAPSGVGGSCLCPELSACSKSREQERDMALRLRKRNVHVVDEPFEAVLTVPRLTKRSRL